MEAVDIEAALRSGKFNKVLVRDAIDAIVEVEDFLFIKLNRANKLNKE